MTDETRHEEAAPAPDHNGQEEMPADNLPDNLLGLKMLVVFLGVLLVIAAITFVFLLIRKMSAPEPVTEPVAISSSISEGEEVPESVLVLAPGEEIVDMSLQGRSLALRIKSPEGERILIVDPYTSDHRAVMTIDTE